jgi:hypothetical protein
VLQTYSMILWAKANHEDFKVTVDKAYRLLSSLKEYGTELSPNYLPAFRKKEVKPYELDRETLGNLLKKGVNKEGERTSPYLGYHVSFFSALNDDDSAGISLTIGMNDPSFTNSLVIHFPPSLNIFDRDISERLIALFKNCVKIISPFWGGIISSYTIRRYATIYKNNLPTTIHWVNFWGEDIIHRISEDKINKASLHSLEKIDSKGYILILKHIPIDDNSEEDIRLQSEVNKRLGL